MPPSSLRQILGAPPSTASPTDSVLVIIDAQNEYAKGQLAVKDVDESRAAIKGLLEKYRDAKGKVVHVQHQVPEGAPIFTPGTELFDEFEELTPKDGEARIVKHHPGAFSETNLKEVLEEFGLNKLVVTGYMVGNPPIGLNLKSVKMHPSGELMCAMRTGTRLRFYHGTTGG
ncbi:Isochorismatase hydrolase [Patellaria atrata CBS 101060]|uniref:Isochorismatase hydrolase n=1 Tax=Patellaria atrata CBS 101060 TaxID=1346257 RepID=A0A9P4SJA2_9PEZI|nr:Isochorismatase hydrolase [Patellaria atrata CBS 101060]